MKAKTITAFAIKNNYGIRHSSINPIKRDCISDFLNHYSYHDWKTLYELGYRCVKVQIKEFNPK